MTSLKSELVSVDQLATVCGGFSDHCKTGAKVGAITFGISSSFGGGLAKFVSRGRYFKSGALGGAVGGVIGGGIVGCGAGSLFNAPP